MHSLVFLDTETTGLDNQSCDLLELSAIRIKDGKKAGKFDSLIKPFSDVPKEIEKLTGITNEEAQQAPEIEKVREKFLKKFIKPDDIIVAHNAKFDLDFLNAKEFDLENPIIDTFEIAQIVCPEEKSLSLEALAIKFEIEHSNAHRALADVEATIGVWNKLRKIVEEIWSEELLDNISCILNKSSWVGKAFFDECQKCFENKEKIAQVSLFEIPEIKTNLQNIKPPTEKEIEISKQISEKSQTDQNVMIEIQPPTREVISVILAAKEIIAKNNNKKIGITFNIKNKDEVLNTVSQLNLGNIQTAFFDLPEYFLCSEKLEHFLLKPHYSDAETTLLLKIIRSIELNDLYHLSEFKLNIKEADIYFSNLSNNDADKCLANCNLKKQKQKYQDSQIILLPHRAINNFDGDYLFFIKADNLEDDLTNLSKTQTTMRVFERLSNKYNSQKYQKFFDGLFFGFGFLTKYIRDQKGESIYPESLIISAKEEQSSEFSNFADFFEEAKNELRELFPKEKFAIDEIIKWQEFFALETEINELKYLTLFPDDSLICTKSLINLTETFNELLLNKKNIVLTSNNFIKTIDEARSSKPTYPFATNIFTFYQLSSEYPFDKCLFLVPTEIRNGDEKDYEIVTKQIINISENIKGDMLCICSSKTITKKIEEELLSKMSNQINVVGHLYGNIEKTRSKIANNHKNSILLMNYAAANDFNLSDCNFDTFVLQKFIFDPPNNPISTKRGALYQNDFFQYVLPKSIHKFLNLFYKGTFMKKPFVFLSIDPKIMQSNSWGKHFFDALPETLPKKFVNNDKIIITLKEFFT